MVAGDDDVSARTVPLSVTSSTPFRPVRMRVTAERSNTCARRFTASAASPSVAGYGSMNASPTERIAPVPVRPVSCRRRADVSQEPSTPAARIEASSRRSIRSSPSFRPTRRAASGTSSQRMRRRRIVAAMSRPARRNDCHRCRATRSPCCALSVSNGTAGSRRSRPGQEVEPPWPILLASMIATRTPAAANT